MMLFVVGNINPEELIGVIKETQYKKRIPYLKMQFKD